MIDRSDKRIREVIDMIRDLEDNNMMGSLQLHSELIIRSLWELLGYRHNTRLPFPEPVEEVHDGD